MPADETFADQLERWLRAEQPKTLGSLGHTFSEKSFAATILLLMFVPALPVPTGGITHVFEGLTVLIAAQMAVGRESPWLPRRWTRRELGAVATDKAIPFIVRWVRRLERHSRPRGVWLFHGRWSTEVLGLLLIGLASTAAIAPPFSGLDTLPAMGAVAVALSIIFEDALLLVVGLVVGAAGVVLILTIGAAVARAVREMT